MLQLLQHLADMENVGKEHSDIFEKHKTAS